MAAFLARGGTIVKCRPAGWGGRRADRPDDAPARADDCDDTQRRTRRASERSSGLRGPPRGTGAGHRCAVTIPARRLSRSGIGDGAALFADDDLASAVLARPKTRGDCIDRVRDSVAGAVL